MELYDCMIFHFEEDLNTANEIVTLLNNNGIKATLFDTNPDFDFIEDRYHRIAQIAERSVLYLSYVPDTNIHTAFDFHYLHASIDQSLSDPLKRWCFLPIWCKPREQYECPIQLVLRPFAETLIYSPLRDEDKFLQALKNKIKLQNTAEKRARLLANVEMGKRRELDERPSEPRQCVIDPVATIELPTVTIKVYNNYPGDDPSFIPPLPDQQSGTTDGSADIQEPRDESMDTVNGTVPTESTESHPIAVVPPMQITDPIFYEPVDELDPNLTTSEIAERRGDDLR